MMLIIPIMLFLAVIHVSRLIVNLGILITIASKTNASVVITPKTARSKLIIALFKSTSIVINLIVAPINAIALIITYLFLLIASLTNPILIAAHISTIQTTVVWSRAVYSVLALILIMILTMILITPLARLTLIYLIRAITHITIPVKLELATTIQAVIKLHQDHWLTTRFNLEIDLRFPMQTTATSY